MPRNFIVYKIITVWIIVPEIDSKSFWAFEKRTPDLEVVGSNPAEVKDFSLFLDVNLWFPFEGREPGGEFNRAIVLHSTLRYKIL